MVGPHLGLEGVTEVNTDPKGSLRPLRLLTLMTEFSVFMPFQGIAPGNSWLGSVSLKDYKIIWKNKSEGNEKKIFFRDFNCTIGKIDADSENKIQRLYRRRFNYVLSKLIVDNGLEDLWGRENLDSSEFSCYYRSSGTDPG